MSVQNTFKLDQVKRHSVSVIVGPAKSGKSVLAESIADSHNPRETLRLGSAWAPLDVNTLLAAQQETKAADPRFRTAALLVDVPNLDFTHVGVRTALCGAKENNMDVCVVANRCPRGAGLVIKQSVDWAFLTSPRRIHGEVGRLYSTFGHVAFDTLKAFEAALVDATAGHFGFLAIDMKKKEAFRGDGDAVCRDRAAAESTGWMAWAASFLW